MSREELKAKLDAAGIEYKKTHKTAYLEKLLAEAPVASEPAPRTYTDEELRNITDSLSGKNRPTIEETLSATQKDDGNAVTPSGIIIPPEVLAKLSRTKFEFVVKYGQDVAEVSKIAPNGKEFPVRTYSRDVHGDNFKALADGFANKNNAK